MQSSGSGYDWLAAAVIGVGLFIVLPVYGVMKLTDAVTKPKSKSKNPADRLSNPRNY